MSDFEFGGMGESPMALPVGVGSWSSFWRKFKGVFKKVAKAGAKSGALKTALNAYSPGAGDAAEKGFKLIDSASSGNPQALAQVKSIADKARAGDESSQKTVDMLSTIHDAKKEAAAESSSGSSTTTTAGAVLDLFWVSRRFKHGGDTWRWVGLRFVDDLGRVVQKLRSTRGEEMTLTQAMAEAFVRDGELVPVASAVEAGGGGGGFHHGGHGSYGMPLGAMVPWGYDPMLAYEDAMWGNEEFVGHSPAWFRSMDPRDMYWGPRIDVDDDGQPILVGHRHHGGGHPYGWGGYQGPGMWYPPMFEPVIIEEIIDDDKPGEVKRTIKKEVR